jgi:UPF0176 protein
MATLHHNIKGTLLLAYEGINGTVAGSEKSILELLDYLKTDPLFEGKFKSEHLGEDRYLKYIFSYISVENQI